MKANSIVHSEGNLSLKKETLIVLIILFPGTSHAYLDPVTGSFIVQGVLAAFGALVVFWKKVKVFFGRILGFKEKKDETEEIFRKRSDDKSL